MSAVQKTKMVITGKLKGFDTETVGPADAPSERRTASMSIVFNKKDLELFTHLFKDEHLLSITITAEKSSVLTL